MGNFDPIFPGLKIPPPIYFLQLPRPAGPRRRRADHPNEPNNTTARRRSRDEILVEGKILPHRTAPPVSARNVKGRLPQRIDLWLELHVACRFTAPRIVHSKKKKKKNGRDLQNAATPLADSAGRPKIDINNKQVSQQLGNRNQGLHPTGGRPRSKGRTNKQASEQCRACPLLLAVEPPELQAQVPAGVARRWPS